MECSPLTHLVALFLSSSVKTMNQSMWVWPKNCPTIVLSNLEDTITTRCTGDSGGG